MTLEDLVTAFRTLADDTVETYLWSTELVEGYADQAEIEACTRKPFLFSTTDPDLCEIDITGGTATYDRNPVIRRVFYARFVQDGFSNKLVIRTRDEMTEIAPDWVDSVGVPKYLIIEDSHFTLSPAPEDDGVLKLELSHIPVKTMSARGLPTITAAHHYNLVYWMLYLAYSKRDADTFNPKKALDYAQMFADYFGDAPSAQHATDTRNVRPDRPVIGGWI